MRVFRITIVNRILGANALERPRERAPLLSSVFMTASSRTSTFFRSASTTQTRNLFRSRIACYRSTRKVPSEC